MKICKVCNITEESVVFYKSDSNICKNCRSEKERKARCEQKNKVYIPKIIVEDGYKICTKCNKILTLDNFYVLKNKLQNGKNRLYSRCKECERNIVLTHQNRSLYLTKCNDNKKIFKESLKYREYLKKLNFNHNQTEKGIITHLLSSAKKRAIKNNLEFSLKREDIILPLFCPILEIPFIKGTYKNYNNTYSLDRIDNSLGYTKENIRIISMLANTMKNSASREQLITFSKNIINYIDKKL